MNNVWNAYDISIKVIYSNSLSPWIYNPVFTHSCIFVVGMNWNTWTQAEDLLEQSTVEVEEE